MMVAKKISFNGMTSMLISIQLFLIFRTNNLQQ
jgi:hypothetical protein